jgi:ribosomal protein S18 acetylase RimI-like enzyme
MANEVSIRPATQTDLEFLVSVLIQADALWLVAQNRDAACFAASSRAATANELSGAVEDSTTYVIEKGGTGVGRLRVVRPGQEIYVAGIQLLPQYQRQGIGRVALGTVIREARDNALPLSLHVVKENSAAKRFYTGLGFVVARDEEQRELLKLGGSESA